MKILFLLVVSALYISCQRSALVFSVSNPFPYQGQNITNAKLNYQCTDPSSRGMGESTTQRLTTPELTNTLTDLLGSDVMQDATVKGQMGQLSNDYLLISVQELHPDPAQAQPAALLGLAAAAAGLFIDNPTKRGQVLGSCAAGATFDTPCVQSIISQFGLKVYRRPLTAAESASFLSSYNDSGGGTMGLKRIFMRFLLGPTLVYHLETGGATAGTRVRLTDYEIASRISYRTTGSMPDAQLFAAAAQGQLQDLSNVAAQTQRLLTSSQAARAQQDNFFRIYLALDPNQQVVDPYAPEGALDGISTTGLGAEMIQETKDYYNNVIWNRNGRFTDLFTSKEVFPRSARMSQILEAPMVSGTTPSLTSTAHAGLILRPAFLADSVNRTAAMHRGYSIRLRLLCQPLPPPPADLVAQRKNDLGDLSGMGNRDQLTLLTNQPVCMACHASISPMGFALEGYDQLGKSRTTENLFNNDVFTKTVPINTAVQGLNLSSDVAQVAASGTDLSSLIANTEDSKACFAQTLFEVTRLRLPASTDNCALGEMENAVGTGSILSVMVNNIANEDIFWKAGGN